MPERDSEFNTVISQIKARYTSMSAGTVRAILRENLELDPNVSEEANVLLLLDSSSSTLGSSNFASYIPSNDAAAATKSKRITELFASGCWFGMKKAAVVGRYLPSIHAGHLSPLSELDFRPMYLGFLGRAPSASEVRELTFLSQGVLRNAEGTSDTDETRARRIRTAVCTAVLSSLEGTRGR